MEEFRLCNSDYRFMMLVWEHAPIGSGELVKLCAEKLGWKKSTTYTEIKRLCEKGVLQNEHAVVTPLVTQEEVQAKESDEFVERTFSGSLPGFLTAFLGNKKLSGKEAEELKKLIDEDVLDGEYIGCHPCINTSSIRFKVKDLIEKVIPAMGHDFVKVKL